MRNGDIAIRWFRTWAFVLAIFVAFPAASQSYHKIRDSVNYFMQKNNVRKSIELSEKALRYVKDSLGSSHEYYSDWMQGLLELNYMAGNLSMSLTWCNRLDSLLTATDRAKTKTYVTLCNSLGLVLKTRGDFEKSESKYDMGIRLLKDLKLTNTTQYAQINNNLAVLYAQLGRYRESEALQKQSIALNAQLLGKEHPEYATGLYNLGLLYLLLKKYEPAIAIFSECMTLEEKISGPETSRYATTVGALGASYSRSGKLQEAYPYLEKARAILEKSSGKVSRDYAEVLFNLGEYYIRKGEYKTAMDFNGQSLEAIRKVQNPIHINVARTTRNQAIALAAMNDLIQSDAYWKETCNIYLTLIDQLFPYQSEREKNQFYSILKEDFFKYYAFLLKNQANDDGALGMIYNLQLRTKAILLNSYARWKNQILESKDLTLIQRFLQWQTMREQIARLRQQRFNQKLYDSLTDTSNSMEKELSARSESFRNLAYRESRSWLDVQARLKSGEAAIEIIRVPEYNFEHLKFTGNVSYLALIVKKNSKTPELVLVGSGNDLEERHLKRYRQAIRTRVPDEHSYNLFWEPVKRKLSGIRKVFLSNDGVYNQINLNTLWNTSTKKYVLDEIDVTIVTNTKDIVNTSTPDNSNRLATVVGSPVFYKEKTLDKKRPTEEVRTIRGDQLLVELPGSLEESNQISDKFKQKGWQVNLLVKDLATEKNLKSSFKPRILHIATHGYFEADTAYSTDVVNPYLKSGLFLSGAGDMLSNPQKVLYYSSDDGVLTAYEAASLNLENSELVVLSACETGLGQIQNGEGVYGLQRSFHLAGANNLMMSLWNVDDEVTRELMITFYDNWLGGMTKYEALKKAQLSLKAKGKSPYYWGPFIMVGN